MRASDALDAMGYLSLCVVLILTLLATSCGDGQRSLYQAASQGKVEEVKEILADGADIDQLDAGGFTALHASIINRHPQVTRYLIDMGANVNTAGIYDVTPLHVATDATTVRWLLAKHARVDAWSKSRGTPLHSAAMNNSQIAVQLLIESGAPLDAGDVHGSTALHHAAGQGRNAIVTLLVDSGATVDAVNDLLFTPMHWAAGNGHAGAVAILLEFGAKPASTSYNGITPRDTALAKGHDEVVRILDAAIAGTW